VSRLVVIVTAILGGAYAYLAWRLASGAGGRFALAVPFFLIWIVPVYYWGSDRDRYGWPHMAVHQASYLSMAWLSFVLVLALARDALLVAGFDIGAGAVVAGSLIAVGIGAVVALRGPRIERVEVPIAGLHPDLEGYRIVQISDLHVGLTIRRGYVERVVEQALGLEPDLVALTGDMVDGPVARLAPHVESLRKLPNAFFILGNHDCYSGAAAWIEHFKSLGARVLLNEHARGPVLSLDARGAPRALAARRRPHARREHVGLRERGHRHLGAAGALRHQPRDHAGAPGAWLGSAKGSTTRSTWSSSRRKCSSAAASGARTPATTPPSRASTSA
jgi:hypothetical protein